MKAIPRAAAADYIPILGNILRFFYQIFEIIIPLSIEYYHCVLTAVLSAVRSQHSSVLLSRVIIKNGEVR